MKFDTEEDINPEIVDVGFFSTCSPKSKFVDSWRDGVGSTGAIWKGFKVRKELLFKSVEHILVHCRKHFN